MKIDIDKILKQNCEHKNMKWFEPAILLRETRNQVGIIERFICEDCGTIFKKGGNLIRVVVIEEYKTK